jgi:hypothetical protein
LFAVATVYSHEANVLLSPLIITPFVFTAQVRSNHKEYNRGTSDRPEYRSAFKAFLRMLSSPDVSDGVKLKIVKTLVHQHIRSKRAIADEDVTEINRRAQMAGISAARDVRKMPPQGTDETDLYQAIIGMSGEYLKALEEKELQAKSKSKSQNRSRRRSHRPRRLRSYCGTLPP